MVDADDLRKFDVRLRADGFEHTILPSSDADPRPRSLKPRRSRGKGLAIDPR